MASFQLDSTDSCLLTSRQDRRPVRYVHKPTTATPSGYSHRGGLGSSRFARHYSGALLLSIPRGTEMFQFPRLTQPALCVQTGVTGQTPAGFPIRHLGSMLA